MNFKALVKTLTPSKDGVLAILGLSVFIVAFVAIIVGLSIAINYVLVLALGEAAASVVIWGIIIVGWVWWSIIDPLYDRYKRIKREIEK